MPCTILSDRAVLRIAGDDARAFLQGMVTQDVMAVAPDAPLWGGLLTPQGKALFDFLLWAGEDGAMLIDCEASAADALARRLTIYRLRRQVTIERSALTVHWSPDGLEGVPDPRLAELGRRWLSSTGGDADPADLAWRHHRLLLGVTEGVAELGQDATLWLECNARELNGVSFTKGCYVGQENTARMHHRSKVNRRLVVAHGAIEQDRTRVVYSELALRVDHRRIDDLSEAIIPGWLAAALNAPAGLTSM